jgi:hypothetical protein
MKKLLLTLFVLIVFVLGLGIGVSYSPQLKPYLEKAGLWQKMEQLKECVKGCPSAPAKAAPESAPAAAAPSASINTTTPPTLVGDLPAAPLSGVPFNNQMLFGYDSANALFTAIHEKTKNILAKGGNLNPEVLRLALRAYACAHAQNLGNPRFLTIIDYSLPSTVKRMWVIDLKTADVSFHTLVAHGKNSGYVNTTQFSNSPNSDETSIGLFLTGDTYTGHNGYSLKLNGLEPGFNDNALQREVVIHGAAYVGDDFLAKYGRIGRSWGCPALSKLVAEPIINEIKNGTLVFSYYPVSRWLDNSSYLHCKVQLPWSW